MPITLKPSDFANAFSAGAKTMQEAATRLVSDYVQTQLKEALRRIQNGELTRNPLEIRIAPDVTHHSVQHTAAIKDVVAQLKALGFDAKYHEEPPYDDGPCRSSPGYEAVHLTF